MVDQAEHGGVDRDWHEAIVTAKESTHLDTKQEHERLVGQAAVGAVVGWTAGAAQEGRGLRSPLRFFDPVPVRMATSPALDAWVVLARMVRLGAPAHLCAAHYLDTWRYPEGAAGFGLANLSRGVPPPLSGAHGNPWSQDAGALGRAAFWGLAHYGDPESAADAALYDASFDHADDGLVCAAAVAWVVAQTGPSMPYRSVLASLPDFVPASSSFSASLPGLLMALGKPDGFVHGSNALSALSGVSLAARTAFSAFLAAGCDSFGSTVGAAAVSDADRPTAAMVAGVLGALLAGSVPPEWVAPLGSDYVAGHGLHGIDPPQALADFAEMVVGSYLKPLATSVVNRSEPEATAEVAIPLQAELQEIADEVADAVPGLGGGTGASPLESQTVAAEAPGPTAPLTVGPIAPSPSLRARLNREGHSCVARLEGVDLEAIYVGEVATAPGQTVNLDLRLSASGNEEVVVDLRLTPPEGWEIASRATEFRAQPGRVTSFPTVLRSPKSWDGRSAYLAARINDTEVRLPIVAKDGWSWVGPMLNADGSGFDQSFLPEKGQEPGQTFATRSALPCRWAPFDGPLDAAFGGAPGVVFLAADVDFGGPGRFELVFGARGGVKAWVDGQLVIQAQDSRGVNLGAPGPFRCEVATAGVSRILVKLVRGKVPTGEFLFVAYREDGTVVFPVVRNTLSP